MRRASKILSDTAAAVEFVPAAGVAAIAFADLFQRIAPVEVDLGCGDGAFLAALAERNPERDYFGVERLVGRVRTACRRITRAGLTNARVARLEMFSAVALLPPACVDSVYIMFPDPWPKRRHQRRRAVTPELLRAVARILRDDGTVRIVTDQRDYFEQIQRIVACAEFFEVDPVEDQDLPQSTFEQRYADARVPIYRLGLRKISEPR